MRLSSLHQYISSPNLGSCPTPSNDSWFASIGGKTSVYPCSVVCRSSMKLMRARSIRAAAPLSSVKRDEAILAPRLKSSMSSASPISQCGRGSKVKRGGLPQVLTSSLADSSGPTGTDSWGMLGMSIISSVLLTSTSRTSASIPLIRSEISFIRSTIGPASPPFFFNAAISSPARFRWRLSSSTSTRMARRLLSSSRMPSTSVTSASIPRSRIAFFTRSGSSLISFISSKVCSCLFRVPVVIITNRELPAVTVPQRQSGECRQGAGATVGR